jgi:transposase
MPELPGGDDGDRGDTSERLDVIPAQYRVTVTKRPKLVCRACAVPVVQMPAPARLIAGGIPTEALSPMCSSRATPITCRYIARRRSWRDRA